MKLHVFSADKNKFLTVYVNKCHQQPPPQVSGKKKGGEVSDQTIHNFGYL